MEPPAQDQRIAPSGEAAEAFRWLPASPIKRALLAVGALAFAGLVFSAYLHPGMVFDLANMVFCG